MLGMSIGKLLVLALIIAAVWYGFKWLGRRNKGGGVSARAENETDLVPCAVCGTYVPRGTDHCGSRQDGAA